MQNLIPNSKRRFPADTLDGNKRLTMYPGSKVPGAGFKETLDASSFNPADTENTPGMGANSSTDLQDQEVNIKIAIVNTEFPEKNDFVNQLPQGCAIFISAPKDRTERERGMLEEDGVVSYSDQLHCVTPEQLRYQLHRWALDNKTRGTINSISLSEVIEKWKFFGICDSKPIKANYASSNFRATEDALTWIKTLHRSTSCKMINYFKQFGVDGMKRPYLWWKIQEVDIAEETKYVLGTPKDGSPVFYLGRDFADREAAREEAKVRWDDASIEEKNDRDGNPLNEQKEIEKMTTVHSIPAIVPMATQSRGLTDNDLAYEVTLPSGRRITKYGFAIFVGRCTKRSLDNGEALGDYESVTDKTYKAYSSAKDACTDMSLSSGSTKLDLILHATSKITG